MMNINPTIFRGKEKKYFFLALIPFLLLLIITISYLILSAKKNLYKEIINDEYSKKVKRVYINTKNHGFEYVEFIDGDNYGNSYRLLNNDSIVKKKGDSILYIYRNDTVIKFNKIKHYREQGDIE